MIMKLEVSHEKYGLWKMLANNVNDEGAKSKVMTITLKVVCYESLGLEDPF
jgi:hypothetical protein